MKIIDLMDYTKLSFRSHGFIGFRCERISKISAYNHVGWTHLFKKTLSALKLVRETKRKSFFNLLFSEKRSKVDFP
jgi:hypothetical protein